MDYKYIEQLLERYWNAESSLEEEAILRNFFRQDELPAHLACFRDLFVYEVECSEIALGEDFDERVLKKANLQKAKTMQVVYAKRQTAWHRLRPMFRAVASVAIVLLVGSATRHFFADNYNTGWDYNAAGYVDTYEQPQDAYEASLNGLQEISNLLQGGNEKEDSTTFYKKP